MPLFMGDSQVFDSPLTKPLLQKITQQSNLFVASQILYTEPTIEDLSDPWKPLSPLVEAGHTFLTFSLP